MCLIIKQFMCIHLQKKIIALYYTEICMMVSYIDTHNFVWF